MNKKMYFILCTLSCNLFAMESQLSDLTLLGTNNQADTVISITESDKQEVDPKNQGDYSVWFKPNYEYAKKFVGKSAQEVEAILSELVTKENAPIAHKEKLEKLRSAISTNALHESWEQIHNKTWIYVTCNTDKILQLREALEKEPDLVRKVHVRELQKENYAQQKLILFEPENYGDYSFCFRPSYKEPSKFVGKKVEEIDSILKTISYAGREPRINGAQLKDLRKAIIDYTLNEFIIEFDTTALTSSSWIYLTCKKENKEQLEAALSSCELVEKLYVQDLTKEKYNDTYAKIFSFQSDRDRCCVGCSLMSLLAIVGGLAITIGIAAR